MSYEFNADEILKIEEQIERNGATFYLSQQRNHGTAPRTRLKGRH
jgi:hypothetical protein